MRVADQQEISWMNHVTERVPIMRLRNAGGVAGGASDVCFVTMETSPLSAEVLV